MFMVLFNDSMTWNGLKCKIGLNVDNNAFNSDCIIPETYSCPHFEKPDSGFHFCTSKEVPFWLYKGDKLAFVSIPDDAKIVNYKNGSKTDKVVINKIINIEDWEMWDDEVFCLIALACDRNSLQYIRNQTPELCKLCVETDGSLLRYIRNQTPELCLIAVRRKGEFNFSYVKNQTPEICLEAVKAYGLALKYVKEQTLEICREAMKWDRSCIEYVNEKFINQINLEN